MPLLNFKELIFLFHIDCLMNYSGCARDHLILNRTNGEIVFCMYDDESDALLDSYYSQTCSWKIMAEKGEQVKLVLKHVELHWCGWSCSCGHLEIENGTNQMDPPQQECAVIS